MAFTIQYETTTCGRCGGSGHYSYNQISGTVCFGCKGRKTVFTRAGSKAWKAVEAFIDANFTVLAETLQVGDQIKVDGVYLRTITEIDRERSASITRAADGTEIRTPHVTVTFHKPVPGALGPITGMGYCPTSKVRKPIIGADWDRVIAFARTIKKGVTVVEKTAAQ